LKNFSFKNLPVQNIFKATFLFFQNEAAAEARIARRFALPAFLPAANRNARISKQKSDHLGYGVDKVENAVKAGVFESLADGGRRIHQIELVAVFLAVVEARHYDSDSDRIDFLNAGQVENKIRALDFLVDFFLKFRASVC